MCDKKEACQAFVLANYPPSKLKHVFQTMEEHTTGEAECLRCGKTCRIDEDCDLLCVSPPCQPFSRQRQKNGKTARTGAVKNHPLFAVPGDITIELIKARNPKVILIEEVTAWNHRTGDAECSPMKLFVATLKEAFPDMGVEVVTLDCFPFMAGSRPRLYMICIKAECGGQAACNEWVSNIDMILDHRRQQGEPTPLTGVNSILTDEILDNAKTQILCGSKKFEDIMFRVTIFIEQ